MQTRKLSAKPKKAAAKKSLAVVLGRSKRRVPASRTQSDWGAVYLDPKEFAEFEKCIQTPQKPTQSILKGAELLRKLYG